jgi:hypothetical protein
MFERGLLNHDGSFVISPDLVARWQRQMNTSYADLPEVERASDREEAYRMLLIVTEKADGSGCGS